MTIIYLFETPYRWVKHLHLTGRDPENGIATQMERVAWQDTVSGFKPIEAHDHDCQYSG